MTTNDLTKGFWTLFDTAHIKYAKKKKNASRSKGVGEGILYIFRLRRTLDNCSPWKGTYVLLWLIWNGYYSKELDFNVCSYILVKRYWKFLINLLFIVVFIWFSVEVLIKSCLCHRGVCRSSMRCMTIWKTV